MQLGEWITKHEKESLVPKQKKRLKGAVKKKKKNRNASARRQQQAGRTQEMTKTARVHPALSLPGPSSTEMVTSMDFSVEDFGDFELDLLAVATPAALPTQLHIAPTTDHVEPFPSLFTDFFSIKDLILENTVADSTAIFQSTGINTPPPLGRKDSIASVDIVDVFNYGDLPDLQDIGEWRRSLAFEQERSFDVPISLTSSINGDLMELQLR